MQSLVSQFDDMIAALSSSADAAATRFDVQQAAAASLSTAMRDSVTSMRDAAALAQQLQAKYVEQTLMLDAATGGIFEDWSCARTTEWEVAFAVQHQARWAFMQRPGELANARLCGDSVSDARYRGGQQVLI
jgi:hypothetical protein